MKLVIALAALLVLFFAIAGDAQPELEWSRNFGGQNEDKCYDLTMTPDGGFLMVGYNESFGHFNEDGWIVCLDEEGDSLWSREFGGDSWEFFFDVIPVEDGYYVSGRYASFEGHLGWDSPWLMKIDEEGEEIWSRTYRSDRHGYILSGAQLNNDGGVSMSGDAPDGADDLFLRKLDDEGRVVWERQFDDDGRDERSYGHCQLADDGYMLVGTVEIPADNDNADGVLIRTNPRGELQWRREFGDRNHDYLYSATELANGNIAAFGSSNSAGWILIIDPEGEAVDSRTYRQDHSTVIYRLIELEDEGMLLVCNSGGALVIRTNAEGEALWSLSPPGSDYDSYPSAVLIPDGGLAIGYTARDNFAIAKYGADPALGWPEWQDHPEIVMNEDEPFELMHDWLDNYVQDSDNDSTELSFAIEAGIHLAVEEIEDGYTLTPDENWFGWDTLAITVTDPDDQWAVSDFAVHIQAANDLPHPFSLLNPEDNFLLDAQQIAYVWEEAAQNEFELDSVRYRLFMEREDSLVTIDGIEETHLIFNDIENLHERFDVPQNQAYTFQWWIEACDREGATESRERRSIRVMAFQGVDGESALPLRFGFDSVTPNPFNSTLNIRYEISTPTSVRLTVIDRLGRVIAKLLYEKQEAGQREVVWDAGDIGAGLYFMVLETGSGDREIRKAVLIR